MASVSTDVLRPMLASAGPVPAGPQWAFEFTWDGNPGHGRRGAGRVRLISGEDRDVISGYPELDVIRGRRGMLLDGKLVALDACGRPSLARLYRRMNVARPSEGLLRRVSVAFYVFDILRLDDRSTLQLTYRQRRTLLGDLGLAGGPVVLPPYFTEIDGQAVLDTAAEYGLHGVIAKRADSTYQPGRRSRSWVETALRHTQEVVVGGWTPGAGGFGSLLVGVPTERGLRYAGRVGTGFRRAARRALLKALAGVEQRTSPFVDEAPGPAGWVAPRLLGEVSYRQWTAEGRLGNPAWRGLRPGKHPAAVKAPVVLPGQHFLYNAVSAIAALVRTDPARAREMLIDFAHFLRSSQRGAGAGTTLADEVDTVERYLRLQQARFGERIQARIRVAPDVLPVALPSLAVQVLVENAVNGIEDAALGGTVTVLACAEGGDCVISVEDDGPGTSPARQWTSSTAGCGGRSATA
ncbi:MAG: hypothetical protein GEV09_16745 [Pseudonocardiaceae bacterium]|nr:hypothetical protein [Pseudonocardiaceae bacterium]